MTKPSRQLHLAASYGFCAGVTRAIELFNCALKDYGEPIYVLHELVHNSAVTSAMKKQGAIFVETTADVPDGGHLLIGAHGITRETEAEIRRRGIHAIDATCPLVKRLHNAVANLTSDDTMLLLGKSGHPEACGIISRSNAGKSYLLESGNDVLRLPDNLKAPFLLSQTTMNYHDCENITRMIRQRHDNVRTMAQVCQASMDRQKAVEELASFCDIVLVIASPHSSNGQRLKEIAAAHTKAKLINSAADLDAVDQTEFPLDGNIGITAGASTPEFLVQEVIEKLRTL